MKQTSSGDCIALFEGLHALLQAGLGLVPALDLLAKQHPRQQSALVLTIAALREGQAFSQALAHYLPIPHLVWIYLRLGERSGDLTQACALCLHWLKRQQAWKRMLWQLSFYPVLLLITSLGLFWVMMGFVLPEFSSLYRTLDLALPPSTAWLLRLGEKAPALLAPLTLILPLVIIGLCLTWRSHQGRFILESFFLKIPGLKQLMATHFEYQIAEQLGTLLQAGSPLLESLDFIRQGSTSPYFVHYLRQVQQKIREGQSISISFCQGWAQDHSFKVLLTHAEQTGELGRVLLNLAKQHEEAFTHGQDRAKHLIQPIITLVMGGFLGVWILLLYYPMLQLGTNLG